MNQNIQAILNYCNELEVELIQVSVATDKFVVNQNGNAVEYDFSKVPGIGEQYTASLLIEKLVEKIGLLKANMFIKALLERNFNYNNFCEELYIRIKAAENLNLKNLENNLPEEDMSSSLDKTVKVGTCPMPQSFRDLSKGRLL